MFLRNGSLAAIVVCVGLAHHSAVAADFFLTDKATDDTRPAAIYRGNMDGNAPLVTLFDESDGLIEPRGLGVDVAGGKIYWTDAGTGKIQCSGLDGSDKVDLITGRSFLADLELDLTAGKMYWTETIAGAFWSADLDGNNMTPVRTGLHYPYYFELDTAGGNIYWSELDNSVIHRMALDGTGPIDTIVSGQDRVRDLGLDLDAGMIYFNDRDLHLVQRAPLDGSSATEELYNFVPNQGKPHGMTLDLDDERIYWTDTRQGARWVMRGKMDGSSSEVLYGAAGSPWDNGLDSPWDIELATTPVPEPSTLAMALVAALLLGTLVRRNRRTA